MTSAQFHPWQVSPSYARLIQSELADEVVCEDRFDQIETVAGVDIGFEAAGEITRAALVILRLPELVTVERIVVREPTRFPYVPGLLSFREVPALLRAFDAVDVEPDLILCDGQGLAHPRRFGLACHLGVLLDKPTIGVAKQRLIGHYQEPSQTRGAWTPLRDRNETIGAVLRTRPGTRPLFVSSGHRIGLSSAIKWVLTCTPRYRLPETTRQAHQTASAPASTH